MSALRLTPNLFRRIGHNSRSRLPLSSHCSVRYGPTNCLFYHSGSVLNKEKVLETAAGQGPRDFYRISEDDNAHEHVVRGEVVDQAADVTAVRPGVVIDGPYEVTVSPSMRDFWHSAFYSHDRINTSTPFARKLKLQDQVLPFNMMLFIASATSHEDQAKWHLGFTNACYHWPAFAGDTFKKRYVVLSLRSTSDNQSSILQMQCQLINQRDVICFTCEKTIMYPFHIPPSDLQVPLPPLPKQHQFINHIVKQAEFLQDVGSQSLTSLRPGQLILHSLTRPLSITASMQLASLGRLTHERHFNTSIYKGDDLIVPSGLILALTCSLASRDLHEILHEEMLACIYPNNLPAGDTVGAMSFIKSLDEHVSGDIEAVTVRTIGIKHCDVHRVYADISLPRELFTRNLSTLPRKQLVELLATHAPALSENIVCMVDRKIYRQTPKQVPFLL